MWNCMESLRNAIYKTLWRLFLLCKTLKQQIPIERKLYFPTWIHSNIRNRRVKYVKKSDIPFVQNWINITKCRINSRKTNVNWIEMLMKIAQIMRKNFNYFKFKSFYQEVLKSSEISKTSSISILKRSTMKIFLLLIISKYFFDKTYPSPL